MVEESGARTVFILTDGANMQFGTCEQWRIYEFKVNGASVKRSNDDCSGKEGNGAYVKRW